MSRIPEENFKSGKCFMPSTTAPTAAAATKTKGFILFLVKYINALMFL